MRLSVTIIAVLVIARSRLMLGQEPATAHLSCVDSLELPTRGLFAAGAGKSGIVYAIAHIGKDGQLSRLELNGGGPRLQAEVRVAMGLSRFTAQCNDRTVEFVFAFTLEGPAT